MRREGEFRSEIERLASGAVCATAQWVRIGTRSYAVRYNGSRHLQTANELFPVKKPDLQAKLAYCAKTRRSNYAASLRLEGYDVTPAESKRKLPSRETVLQTYRKPA